MTIRGFFMLLLTSILLLGCFKGTEVASTRGVPVEQVNFLAPPLTIDTIYPSMKGPGNTDLVALDPGNEELAWITGFSAVMVDEEGEKVVDQEYMCHTNLDIANPAVHVQKRPPARFNPGRLFTISQGQSAVDLPPGFGIPLKLATPMAVGVQALNLNKVPETPFKVRHKITFNYVEQSELEEPLVPLFVTSGLVLKALDPSRTRYGVDNQAHDDTSGGTCLVGPSADNNGVFKDEHGNPFTAHWVVPPGREVNRTTVTEMLAVPYDTEIHYILAHVHPFCESLELIDTTTGESVVKLTMKQHESKIGLSHTEHFTSLEGLQVYKDHEYEMVSVYSNDSGKDQDAMAVMLMFMRDKAFNP